jgi:hypothetical protein
MGAPALERTSIRLGGTHMPSSEMSTITNAGTYTLKAALAANRSRPMLKM